MKDDEILDRGKGDPDQQMYDDEEEEGANPYKEVLTKMQKRKNQK